MNQKSKHVGLARSEEDGTIRLNLVTQDDAGRRGEATIVVVPGDDDYEDTVTHLGGIAPGESKPIPPWPDSPPKP